MVPAARAAPRLEANTTPPKPASFRNSRRSIGCFMDDSLRTKKGLWDAIPPPDHMYSRGVEFMGSGIKRVRARYYMFRPRKNRVRSSAGRMKRIAHGSFPTSAEQGDRALSLPFYGRRTRRSRRQVLGVTPSERSEFR